MCDASTSSRRPCNPALKRQGLLSQQSVPTAAAWNWERKKDGGSTRSGATSRLFKVRLFPSVLSSGHFPVNCLYSRLLSRPPDHDQDKVRATPVIQQQIVAQILCSRVLQFHLSRHLIKANHRFLAKILQSLPHLYRHHLAPHSKRLLVTSDRSFNPL